MKLHKPVMVDPHFHLMVAAGGIVTHDFTEIRPARAVDMFASLMSAFSDMDWCEVATNVFYYLDESEAGDKREYGIQGELECIDFFIMKCESQKCVKSPSLN